MECRQGCSLLLASVQCILVRLPFCSASPEKVRNSFSSQHGLRPPPISHVVPFCWQLSSTFRCGYVLPRLCEKAREFFRRSTGSARRRTVTPFFSAAKRPPSPGRRRRFAAPACVIRHGSVSRRGAVLWPPCGHNTPFRLALLACPDENARRNGLIDFGNYAIICI